MSNLLIFRASAGSGKTSKLTEEYLALLFQRQENYRHILSVTFTNKAKEEMKRRIITELHRLSCGESSHYMESLTDRLNLTPAQIQEKAGAILKKILHDYSRFSVETIDSFFQRIIRAFARETGLQSGFTVELDRQRVLLETTDRLLSDIEINTPLCKWLISFAENKIEEGHSWNLRKDIMKLGEEVFREEFLLSGKSLSGKMDDKDFLTRFRADLQKIKFSFEHFMKTTGQECIQIITNHSLTIEDFSNQKRGFANYFYKIATDKNFEPGSRTREAYENPEKWSAKKTPKEIRDKITDAYHAGLNTLLGKALEYYDQNNAAYNSAQMVLNYIYTLGILADLTKKIRDYTREENIFLISDTVKFLSDIIGDNETPFIYEKTGSVYRHFMIDEFQDTSRLQWKNIRPLVNNSLSEGNTSLVVGDVKQSIYRWRNSDWKLLAEQITREYSSAGGVKTFSLVCNRRSLARIVEFNNVVFRNASVILQEHFNNNVPDQRKKESWYTDLQDKITQAYQDAEQKISGAHGTQEGYVRLILAGETETGSWKDTVNNQFPLLLEELQEKGFRPGDMVILVRTADEGKAIADTLLAYRNSEKAKPAYSYDFVSNESLFIRYSKTVRFILNILRHFRSPEDPIIAATIRYEYNTFFSGKERMPESLHEWFEAPHSSSLFYGFPEEIKQRAEQIRKLPLFEMTEEIASLFRLQEDSSELPYLLAFQDAILKYLRKHPSDTAAFLDWWDEEGSSATMNFSEQQDAVRIMTIHKAKGLEFKVVLIPYCNWTIDHPSQHSNILWCKPSSAPFNEMDLLPVRYSSKLADTIFYQDYFSEKLHAFVDNLNLMYVAFTRAREVLCAFIPALPSEKNESFKTCGDLLRRIVREMYDADFGAGDHNTCEIGSPEAPVTAGVKSTGTFYSMHHAAAHDDPELPAFSRRLMLKHEGTDYFSSGETTHERLNYGKLMHELLKNIITINDIPEAVQMFVHQGKLSETEADVMKEKMNNLLAAPDISSWFDGDWHVMTEPPVLLPSGKMKRPDRVLIKNNEAIVIDYKFGEEKSEHSNQMKEYVLLLKSMNYEKVTGYVWYPFAKDKKIIQ